MSGAGMPRLPGLGPTSLHSGLRFRSSLQSWMRTRVLHLHRRCFQSDVRKALSGGYTLGGQIRYHRLSHSGCCGESFEMQ